ncbi:MAG: hydroxymyristoyl-ACP dehydratase [Vicinamibacterales bacterium]
MSERSRCFDGHFDGAPILPGVAHLALALSACAAQSGRAVVLKALRDFRLKNPLMPGDDVDVRLTPGSDASEIRFEIRRRGEAASVGVLIVDQGNPLE